MRILVPIKIKVVKGDETKGESPMAHPPFRYQGVDIYNLIDRVGIGQHYEKNAGFSFGEDEQWTMTALPKDIAEAFIIVHPTRVFKMSNSEAQDFYENKAHIDEQDELIDVEIVQGIKLKQDLGLVLTVKQLKALDPNDSTPGIRKNLNKKWANFKVERKFTV